MNLFKKATLATALVASAAAGASPAMARDYYGHHRSGDATGAAIVGGVIGLALGAIIASSSNDHHRDRDYRNRDGFYYRDGYTYDRNGYRDDRQRYDGRDYYNRRGYRDDGYYRGY